MGNNAIGERKFDEVFQSGRNDEVMNFKAETFKPSGLGKALDVVQKMGGIRIRFNLR